VKPKGTFVVLRLRVANHAKRVDYALSQHTPVLEDSSGDEFRIDVHATELLARETAAPALPASIHAGDQISSEIVFDVPSTAKALRLRITWGEAINTLDQIVCGDRTIMLEP
jgi:hypothetical protein